MVINRLGVAFMPSYRVYCLDGAKKVTRAEWIEADDDDSALLAARQFDDAVQCEVWQGRRLIGRVDLDFSQVEEN